MLSLEGTAAQSKTCTAASECERRSWTPGEKRKSHSRVTAKSLLVISTVRDARIPFLDVMRGGEDTGITIYVDELASELAKVNRRTGCRLGNITARTLKSLGEQGVQCITGIFNKISAGCEKIPADWEEGRKRRKRILSRTYLIPTDQSPSHLFCTDYSRELSLRKFKNG